MLQEIWLAQPLAFARAGTSPEPCDAYEWGPNDLTPSGTGRTKVAWAQSLGVDPETGVVSALPRTDTIAFKDSQGRIKPVCPFFELWGRDEDGREFQLTREHTPPEALYWEVRFNNRKAFHWTGNDADRIEAFVSFPGGETRPQRLDGRCIGSPPADSVPLLPAGRTIPLGSVQATAPNCAYPQYRLRFTPGNGLAYAPRNVNERIRALSPDVPPDYASNELIVQMIERNKQWTGVKLPADRCILDPEAAWPRFKLFDMVEEFPRRMQALLAEMVDVYSREEDPSELLRLLGGPGKDMRNLPPGLYAWVVEPPNLMASLGMVDDLGDGVITCRLDHDGKQLSTQARIVSGPPAWAPDRRPVVSLADGLADRVDRRTARGDDWEDEAEPEMRDLLDRAFETVGLANLDALNMFFVIENQFRASRPESEYSVEDAERKLWGKHALASPMPLPLTAAGVDRHRRNAVDMFFDAYVVAERNFFKKHVREPGEPQRLYDKRMPGLMRGGDRRPLTLTRRQYDTFRSWIDRMSGPREEDEG